MSTNANPERYAPVINHVMHDEILARLDRIIVLLEWMVRHEMAPEQGDSRYPHHRIPGPFDPYTEPWRPVPGGANEPDQPSSTVSEPPQA